MSRWTYEFRDLASGSLIDTLPLSGVSFDLALNTAGALSATIPDIGAPDISRKQPRDLTTPAYMTVTAVRDALPIWGGVIWASDYDSTPRRLSFGAADWWSYFDHRYVLPALSTPVATDHVAGLSTVYSSVDQNDIARQLVALAQSHTAGDIGIEADTTTSSIYRDRTYRGYELVTVGDALRKLTGVIDGPDIAFGVAAGNNGAVRRIMRTGNPTLTQPGEPHVAEYGRNLRSYRWPRDGSRMATRAYAVGDGLETAMPIAVAEDTTAYATGWRLLEMDAGYNTVQTPSVLQDHANADQLLARQPVALPTLTLRGDGDPVLGSYHPGDLWRVIIRDDFHGRDPGLDAIMRCVRINVRVGEAGEEVTLTMSPLIEEAT